VIEGGRPPYAEATIKPLSGLLFIDMLLSPFSQFKSYFLNTSQDRPKKRKSISKLTLEKGKKEEKKPNKI